MKQRNYGKVVDAISVPDLNRLQTSSYEAFLQKDVSPSRRKNQGLEAILRETFPIESYDGSCTLRYIRYTLGRPRYTPEECRKLRLTYAAPFRVLLRIDKEEPVQEEVYLGEIPLMIGGGEFIVNGAERVIVTQLHRSPGVDFLEEGRTADRRLHSCRIIPERGSWIELTVTKKDVLTVRVDQSGQFPATCLLRAMSPDYSTNADIIQAFYETETIAVPDARSASKLKGRRAVGEIKNEEGDVIVPAGGEFPEAVAKMIAASPLNEIEVIKEVDDPLILNTIQEDQTTSHEEALLRIYSRLRPGNPPHLEKAKQLFYERFFDSNRYRLGRVGRFRINRKFGLDTPEDQQTLTIEDFVNCIKYLLKLRNGEGEIDDIDHLGNRRVRTIDELAGEEFRKGFLRLKRTVQERMSVQDPKELTPKSLINAKTVSAAIDYFFGRGELSQVVEQTNPLDQLTHERKLSALGPGGLNRKRAGFEVRDVHISHYGRICPIETPEGTNIGLITSLCIFADVDEYGYLTTPYVPIEGGRPKNEVRYLRADEEQHQTIAPADASMGRTGKLSEKQLLARTDGEFEEVRPKDIRYMDVSPKQIVGVSASLIPFLEHNDANRALMGSNMQRQAVPLIRTEPPLVATGMEKAVAENSGMVVRAKKAGVVTYVSADRIVIDKEEYRLRKFQGLNERTCLSQTPIVRKGQRVRRGEVIADGAATHHGELSLGRNVLVAFMTWDGYNFEDAILISEALVKNDMFTSIHIQEFECEIRETKLGREEFTRDIPNVPEKALRNLDADGIVRVGTHVKPGDILVGKVSPKTKTELSPEEKLLHAIFGRAGEDVKNDSLEAPSGVEGIVIDTQKISRRASLSEQQRKEYVRELNETEKRYNTQIAKLFTDMLKDLRKAIGGSVRDTVTNSIVTVKQGMKIKEIVEMEERFDIETVDFHDDKKIRDAAMEVYRRYAEEIERLKDDRDRELSLLKQGDELPAGVLEMVKVYIATKRVLSVGDKMAGRHGNKGVIAKILPEEEMPFLADGTPVQIVLNPLGVPSRMNVGQILETHLGWASHALGFQAICPVFDGPKEEEIRATLKEAGLPEDGKVTLYDGRTGEPFEQKVTVGYIYMMKLDHLVDDKIHARATGPYSLVTQQPLGGKARAGGQRFGEMEVWAIEAYGAAYLLQELLTVKSDDIEGRTKIYESMVRGTNTLEAGTPVSFDVLTNEIRGLGIKMELERRRL